jgi:TolB-like protein
VALRRQKLSVGVVGVLLLIGLGAAVWYALPHGTPGGGQPAIAVLPLDNIGYDEATNRLADGLTEDIITDLARFQGILVIARNSTMIYKGKAVDVRQVGKDLDVGYVLEGSIQRHADQIRITAQLINADTGAHIWADSWDRPLADTFAVQTEIAERVAGSLASTTGGESIAADQIRKLKGRPPASLTAYDDYLLAVEGDIIFTKESMFAGVDYATKAIALDPAFARAYGIRARLEYNTTHYGVDYEKAMRAMEADARRAVELDPNDPETRDALAWYLAVRGRNAESEIEIRKALEVNPSNVLVLNGASSIFAFNGHPEDGAKLADKALRIDPRANALSLNTLKDAYFLARRFKDVIAVVSRVPEDARGRGSRLFLAFSYALLGQHDDAERARAAVLAHYPKISAEQMMNQGWIFTRPQEQNLFLDGFRATNLPLCAADADLAKFAMPVRLPECLKQTAK